MSFDYEATSTDFELNECRMSHAVQLEVELAAAAACYPLPRSGVEAFAPDTVPLHYLGLAGEDVAYTHDSEQTRREAIADLAYYWDGIYENKMVLEQNDIGRAVRQPRGNLVQVMAISNDIALSGPDMQRWAQHLRENVNDGLRRSDTMDMILPRVQLLYYPESPPVWEDDELTIDNIPPSDLEELFAPGVVPEGITYQELAARLLERDRTDFSQETLDARFNNFVGLAQIELSTIILKDLTSFSNTGGSRIKKTTALAARYRDGIVGDDLVRKQEIIRDFADECRKSAEGIKSAQFKRVLSLMGARARNLATNIDEFMQFFTNTYDAYGYDLPSLLQIPEEPPKPAPYIGSAVTVAAVEVVVADDPVVEEVEEAVAVPEPVVSAEVISDIMDRSKALLERAASTFGPWRMKSAERKGYNAVVRELVEGFRNAVGTQVIEPVIKDHTHELIAVIVRLDAMAAKNAPDEVLKKVAAAIGRQHDVRAQAEELRKFAQTAGYSGELRLPEAVEIERRVHTLAEQWPAFRQLILKTWPNFGGPGVVGRLDPILQQLT